MAGRQRRWMSGGLLCLALWGGCAGPDRQEGDMRSTKEDIRLADEVEAAARAAQGTLGQEAANWLYDDIGGLPLLRMLRGAPPPSPASLIEARSTLRRHLGSLRDALTWPQPQSCAIPRAARPPRLDGTLTDPIWAEALTFRGMHPLNDRTKISQPATTWKILWDSDCLYFGFQCQDADVRALPPDREADAYNADCVEMYLLPDFNRGEYWEIDINPLGHVYDALNIKKLNGWGGVARVEETVRGMRVATHVRGTVNDPSDADEGYTVEVAIPFRALPGYGPERTAAPGDRLRFMLMRLDQNADGQKAYAFCPLHSWGHNIWNHWEMTLQP